MSTAQVVQVETVADGSVSLIRIDDGKANALSKDIIATIAGAIDEAANDKAIGAVVLAGREGRFSGGFDLSVMQSGDFSAIVNLVADGGELVRNIFAAPVPVVAACTGHAVAAGALTLLGCDVRIGAEGAYKIGLNEVAIGMVLPEWAMTISRERLSKRHLQQAIVNARLFDPTAATDAGFLDRVVPLDDVLDAAVTEAAALASSLVPVAYARSVEQFRSDVLGEMDKLIAADRAAVG